MIAATSSPPGACGGCSPSSPSAAGYVAHPVLAPPGDRALHPGRPARPGRAVAARAGAATSSPAACCSASRPASWPSPAVTTTTERTESEGRILLLFDVSLSMMATDVEPTRLDAAKEAAREFVDQVDDDVEVGLISFSGNVTVEVDPTLDRERLDQGIEDLELAESTAIGDALATGTDLLVQPGRRRRTRADDGRSAPGRHRAADRRRDDRRARRPQDGAQEAADAGVPVFTIAFGTAERLDHRPGSGEELPVPVQPEPLEQVAETTGGAAYEAATGDRADRRLRAHPGQPRRHARRGDRGRQRADVEVGRARPRPHRRRLGPRHVVAPRHGLTRRRHPTHPSVSCTRVLRAEAPHEHSDAANTRMR